MENFTLIALIEHIKGAMAEFTVRRVVQHQPNGFMFQSRSVKMPSLKIFLDTGHPAIYPSAQRPPVEFAASDFLMVLRKHLTSAELLHVVKPLGDRIVEFGFKTSVPSKELERMTMVVELIPNAPNLILLDAERRVVSSFRPLSRQHVLGDDDVYTAPRPADARVSLEEVLSGEVPVSLAADPDPGRELLRQVSGMGPVFATEVAYRCRRSGKSVAEETQQILDHIRRESHSAWLYSELPLQFILESNDTRRLSKAVLSPVTLESMERTGSSREFPNVSELCRYYFDELETRLLLNEAKKPLLRELRNAVRKLEDRRKRVLARQAEFARAEELKQSAQLVQSSGAVMDQRLPAVEVTDYFAEARGRRSVELDPALTVRENVDRLFRKYQKAVRGAEAGVRQLAEIDSRVAGVEERVRRIEAIRDWDTWLAVSDRIVKQKEAARPEGGMAARTRAPRPPRPSAEERVRRFRSTVIDGFEVLVGRSSRENDDLTFGAAAPDDFWFHVADYSGSHVVVRNPNRLKSLPDPVLEKAAALAAFHSQARNSPRVEVHYTRKKHVTKPRRTRPGLARLLEFKSLKIEPRNWLEE